MRQLTRPLLVTGSIIAGFLFSTVAGTPVRAGSCSDDIYIPLAYPNDLLVANSNGVNSKYLIPQVTLGKYYSGANRPPVPDNKGLIWVPKEACDKDKVNLLITLHGHRSLKYAEDPANDNIYLQSSGQKHIETIANSLIKSGKIAPLIIAAPMDDRGPKETVWNKEDYNVNTHITKIKEALQSKGITVGFSQVSLMGHSNANCGGGLARAAQELSDKLYLYGAVDGTCGTGKVGNAVFFDKYNVLGTVSSKGGILFHMHQSISDSKAVEEIKDYKKGTLDPEPANPGAYTEMWRSEDGTMFSYAFPSNDDSVGHGIAPEIFIKEVLPRFFTKDGYNPADHPAAPGVGSGATPVGDVQIWNSITGDRQPLTESEIGSMLAKPVPKITIPGLKFSDAKITEEHGRKFIIIPYLGEYIAAVYRYAVVATSVIAVVMLIVAGVQWMVPDASAENINAAKARIEHALIGLLLAVGSYTVLYAVNPELVQFRSLRVQYVAGQDDTGADAHGTETEDGSATADGRAKEVSIGSKDQLQCPGFEVIGENPHNIKERAICYEGCLSNLPAEKRSKPARPQYQSNVLGKIDCNVWSSPRERELSSIKYIGIHESGSVVGSYTWWRRLNILKGEIYGTHYFIERSGKIVQITDEKFNISHGVKNDKSIGIDLDPGCKDPSAGGGPEESLKCNYTMWQYNSLKNLIADIESRVGHKLIPIGHCEVNKPSSADAHIDPRNFDWTQLGESNSTHHRGKCIYLPGFTPGSKDGLGAPFK